MQAWRAKACLQSAACEEARDEIEKAGKAGIGLFVAGCDAPECLEGTEEVLDQMAPFVHFGVMGDTPGTIGFGRNDRYSAAFIEVGTQPVVVESLVNDQRRKIETGDQRFDADAIVTLAGQQYEANEMAEGVDQSHDFRGSGRHASGLWPDFESPFCAGAMLVGPDERAVDEDIFEIRILAERLEDPLPDPLLRPAPEARIDGEPPAERFRQIAPRRAGARNPKNRFDKEPVVAPAAAGVTGFA